jgi:hypothetical protein
VAGTIGLLVAVVPNGPNWTPPPPPYQLKKIWTIKQEEEPIINAITDESVDPVMVEELIVSYLT